MQNNASVHRSRSTLQYLAEHGIFTLEWPACSPDINPIENLWGLLVRNIYRDNKQYTSVHELKEAILEAWSGLDVLTLDNLAKNIPNRLIQVVKCSGGPINYCKARRCNQWEAK